jgi:hypothetical protein
MSPARPLWHLLLTVFQIVALVAFLIVGAEHSNAGTAHTENATIAAVAPMEAQEAEQIGTGTDRAVLLGDESTIDPCGLCCCHAPFVRWASYAVTVTWKPERRLAGLRAIAFDSLHPETLSEPPRPFA